MAQNIKKLIIWLFEKYCFDDWVLRQQEEAKREFIERHHIKNEEYDEALKDEYDRPLKEAFDAGANYAYEKINKEGYGSEH